MELKAVAPDLIAFLETHAGLHFDSAVELSEEIVGRIVREKKLYEACMSRRYLPKLFERASEKVSIEEVKDKVLHELAIGQQKNIVTERSNQPAEVEFLSQSNLIILDGKMEVVSARSIAASRKEGCCLLVLLNCRVGDAYGVAENCLAIGRRILLVSY
uniref:Uncharacterized protein n=1 Tax=Ditylenchus dipsaci TaxID=166011 RepID=A0A915EKJ3_9BILA